MRRTKEEYGGFLPLELKAGKEYHNYKHQRRFNCAKAALENVLKSISCNKIYIPYYLCPNVCMEVEKCGKEVVYYNINKELLPIGIDDESDVCIYLVDYFGVINRKIKKLVASFKYATIIVDFCHSFFSDPIWSDNVYNIYSCKKFFGVSDGAYLIGNKVEGIEEGYTFMSQNAQYLLESLEHGTNYCYFCKKEVDKFLSSNYGDMSILSHKILESIDYEYVESRRSENFQLYEKAFKDINKIKCEYESVPYIYPLCIDANIKSDLVNEKIYVPTLWGQMLDARFKGWWEYELSEKTLFLPVDQRYDADDVSYIVQVVKKIMENVCE